MSRQYTNEQLDFIFENVEDYTWEELATAFNEEFDTKKTMNSIRGAYRTWKDFDYTSTEEVSVAAVKSTHSARKGRSKASKELKAVLDELEARDTLLEEVGDLIKNTKFKKVKLPKLKKSKSKTNMTKELMLTDLHFGKKTATFSYQIAQQRLQKLTKVFLEEIERDSKNYDVERAILFLGGDIVESADFHGKESLLNSEFTNMEQIRCAIESLFKDVVEPIASTGIKVTIPAICGNHDRIDPKKTYFKPGKEYMTWVIYNTLKMLCEAKGYTNVDFIIPETVYATLDIYGSLCLYEHGDHNKHTEAGFETHISKRSKQVGTMIDFFRCGHLHTYTMIGRGRIIRNASLAGNDGYSEILGFNSEASQTINSYVQTKSRPTSFYRSFPVYLED